MNILVTGGGTVAPIDDVRKITNTSTGRFSAAISEAALRRGARVWHLHMPGAIVPFPAQASVDLDADLDAFEVYERLRFLKSERETNRDRLTLLPLVEGTVPEYAEVLRELLTRKPFDAVFLAMAVSDFAPEFEPGKLSSQADDLILHCRRVPKVIAAVRDWVPEVYLVGFKLLSGVPDTTLIDQALKSCLANRLDLTVANDLQLYQAGRHTVHLVRPEQPVVRLGGMDIARRLLDHVFTWIAARER
jgi:phosphopantothenoylcysteine synthetase/decarboxylase